MDKLEDVREWLNIIAVRSDSLLNGEYGELNSDQLYAVHNIHNCATDYLPRLLPQLNEMLETHSILEAVRQISTEWRTPITSIKGFSAMLLMKDLFGTLTEAQTKATQEILNAAEALWSWSNSGSE